MKIKTTYYANKKAAAFHNTDPSMTDQSQAADTDINVIVKRHAVTGAIATGKQPIYADFTELPQDLRTAIETAKGVHKLRASLPDALKEMPIEDLLRLTPEQLLAIHTPAQPSAQPTEQKT